MDTVFNRVAKESLSRNVGGYFNKDWKYVREKFVPIFGGKEISRS